MTKQGKDDGATRQTELPDEKSTRMVDDSGVVAQLKARFGDRDASAPEESLSLYTLSDTIVVGRGSAADWQLEDDSLSRKHCQFRWTGRDLTVEDLGSANGTKVNGKGVVRPEPVRPGDQVQLGTVVIRFEPRGAAANPDALATRLVESPKARPQDRHDDLDGDDDGDDGDGGGDDNGRAPLAPVATVLRLPPTGPAKANAQVFRPPQHAARPDEPTQSWDKNAVLVKQKEPSLDMRGLWHTHRRPMILGGAAIWVGALGLLASLLEKPPVEDDPFAAQRPSLTPPNDTGKPDKVGVPVVTPLGPPVVEAVPASAEARPQLLAQAVAAYEQGRLADSLQLWRRLAADGTDRGAAYMVKLLDERLKAAP